MSDVYSEVFYHLVWATKQREPMIAPRMESLIYTYLRQKCGKLNVFTHALNGMHDHLHLACSIPPNLSVAECVKVLKGGSAHHINHLGLGDPLCWQPGYGVLTFARRDLPRIMSYVEGQKAHHAAGTLSLKMETTSSVPEGLSPSSPAL